MYLALYRKYRPLTFSDVISQAHITTTLQNQIKTNQTAHAYLFTGSRGTGKTTCAKVLAKAVNCLSPIDGNPCLECSACLAVDNGATDVVEIDAASNNSVDNVRQLRDELGYLPVELKYRVFIIDEVHMLSISAFNALLKTIEEPPGHVVFILATTESHKVPATVLSRCQRFEFHRIDMQESAERLVAIAKKENVQLEPNAALLISRISEGGMRDALSLLDTCISVSDNVTVEIVRDSAGIAGKEHLFGITQAAAKKDTASAISIIDSLYNRSKDLTRLVDELIYHYRNLMLIKSVPNSTTLLTCLPDEVEEYRVLSQTLTLHDIMRCLKILENCFERIGHSKNARITAETAIVEMCNPTLDTDADALSGRIAKLEQKLRDGFVANVAKPAPAAPVAPVTIEPVATAEPVVAQENPQPLPTPEVNEEPQPQDNDLPPPPPDVADEYPDYPFPIDFDTENVPFEENAAIEQEIPEAQVEIPQSQSQPQPTPTDGANVDRWVDILGELPPFVSGLLDDTTAQINGDRFVINCSEIAKSVIENPDIKAMIEAKITEMMDEQYKIVINSKEIVREHVKSPAEIFLEEAANRGVEIKYTN